MTSFDEFQPTQILNWALSTFKDLVITTGLNLSGTVLIDIAARAGYTGEVAFVDTSYHFAETLKLWQTLEGRYRQLKFTRLQPEFSTGPLFSSDPAACCATNKIAPLNKFLDSRKPSAILNARTRESAITRKSLQVIEKGNPARINPLIHLTRADLESYAKQRRLAIHPLYQQGFLSMGCWPCTRAVKRGEDSRSGRFAGQGRTECGIWQMLKEGIGTGVEDPPENRRKP